MGAARDPADMISNRDAYAGPPPESGTRPSMAEQRDTVVDPPSPWARFLGWIARTTEGVVAALRRKPLSARLPPLPPHRSAARIGSSARAFEADERGELLFLEIMRASPEYQRATGEIVRYAHELRRSGEKVYAAGFVHLALSRKPPDPDGTIPITRLRAVLCDLPLLGVLMPALALLEEGGDIELLPPDVDSVPPDMPRELAGTLARIRVLAVV